MGLNFKQFTIIAIPILLTAAIITANEVVSNARKADIEVRREGIYNMPLIAGDACPDSISSQKHLFEGTQPLAVLFVGICHECSMKIVEQYLPALRASKNTLIVAEEGATKETLTKLKKEFGEHARVIVDEGRVLTRDIGITWTPLFCIVDENEVLFVQSPIELPDIGGIQAILYKDNFK